LKSIFTIDIRNQIMREQSHVCYVLLIGIISDDYR